MAAPIKMDELLVSWLGSDDVYENVLKLIEKYDEEGKVSSDQGPENSPNTFMSSTYPATSEVASTTGKQPIPPFYPLKTSNGVTVQRRRKLPRQFETWDPLPDEEMNNSLVKTTTVRTPEENSTPSGMVGHAGGDAEENSSSLDIANMVCVRDQISKLLQELQILPQEGMSNDTLNTDNNVTIALEVFVRITKEICHFPSFFNAPLYQRIVHLWNTDHPQQEKLTAVTLSALEWYWKKEMEPFDPPERFFRLVKQPGEDCILRDDFLPYIKALLNDHPVRTNAKAFFHSYVVNADGVARGKIRYCVVSDVFF